MLFVVFQGKLDKRGFGISWGFLPWGGKMKGGRDSYGKKEIESEGEAGDCAGGVA